MFQGKTEANHRETPWAGRTGPAGHPAPRVGSVPFSVYRLYFAFVAHEKKLVQ
jgi:hypothetical protein